MAVVVDRQKVDWKATGKTVTVPMSSKAKLMYYFNCVCSVLHMDNDVGTRRLRDFAHFYYLTESETDRLLILCILLTPDKLMGKCFFQDDGLCGDSNNEFYEVSALQNRLLLTEHILLGGRKHHVDKVMCFKMVWIQYNYFQPIKCFSGRLDRLQKQLLAINYNFKSHNSNVWGCCTIL